MKKFRRKPKPYIEAIVRGLIPKFTKLCALEKTPIVTFSRPEVRQLVSGRKRSMGPRTNGVAYQRQNLIWINPNHESADGVRDTLAHEFCHLRFPYMAHTSIFDQKVNELLNGNQFKPYKRR